MPQKNPGKIDFRSGQLFEIAQTHGLLDDATQIGSEELDAFGKDYLQWAHLRDRALLDHLRQPSTLFRVYLPYTNRVFRLAAQVVWYLDEIIVRDPLTVVLDTRGKHDKPQKDRVAAVIRLLRLFHDSIEQGYILLLGADAIPSGSDDSTPLLVGKILRVPAVLDELKRAARCSYREVDSRGNQSVGHLVELDSGAQVHVTLPGGSGEARPVQVYPWGDFGEISAEELAKRIGKDPFLEAQTLFAGEILRTLRATALASEFAAGVMFDRDLDDTILKHADSDPDDARQTACVGVLRLTLPYVLGVPPRSLESLRSSMPNAFTDFRARLFELIEMAKKEGVEDEAELAVRVEREIIPSIRSLDAEQKAALNKAGIIGVGVPLVSAVAVLSGSMLSAPAAAILAAGCGGLYTALKELSAYREAQAKAQAQPFYFLWRAQEMHKPTDNS